VDEYRSAISKSDDADDADVLEDLLAISRWLDRRLGRFFGKDAIPTDRVYWPVVQPTSSRRPDNWAESENPWVWGGWSRSLDTVDMAEVPTAVVVDGDADGVYEVTLATTDYEVWPPNAAAGPEPAPYTRLYVPNWSTFNGFGSGHRVKVTTRHGWPAVPAPLNRGTIQLTAILRLDSPRATSRIDEMGTVVGTSQQAKDIVERLVELYEKRAGVI